MKERTAGADRLSCDGSEDFTSRRSLGTLYRLRYARRQSFASFTKRICRQRTRGGGCGGISQLRLARLVGQEYPLVVWIRVRRKVLHCFVPDFTKFAACVGVCCGKQSLIRGGFGKSHLYT